MLYGQQSACTKMLPIYLLEGLLVNFSATSADDFREDHICGHVNGIPEKKNNRKIKLASAAVRS